MPGGRQIGGPRLKALLSRAAGITLHRFAGVRTHDPTSNFKLYSRRFLDDVTIESRAGFELALELTVKATIAGREVAELPDHLARPNDGYEQLQALAVAPALPSLVFAGFPVPLAAIQLRGQAADGLTLSFVSVVPATRSRARQRSPLRPGHPGQVPPGSPL